MKRTAIRRRTPMKRKPMKRARPPKRDEAHRRFIRQLPCVVCLFGPAECAHIRFSSAAHGKVNPGMGNKHDAWCVPLCANCHRLGPAAQHSTGAEADWWARQGIDPLTIAQALYACTGDIEAGWRIVRQARAA